MTQHRITIQERHFHSLCNHLLKADGNERGAYVLFKEVRIPNDPWDNTDQVKFLSRKVFMVPEAELLESTPNYARWPTTSFISALKVAQKEECLVAFVHNHPSNFNNFSKADDYNERELVQLAQNRNGPSTKLLSLIFTTSREVFGRIWSSPDGVLPISNIIVIGDRFRLFYPGRGDGVPPEEFHRQILAFGPAFTEDLGRLRVGIIGCGGTGSGVAQLLPRLGVKNILLIDKDTVDTTNLNRLHGATREDAKKKRPKTEVIARAISQMDINTNIVIFQTWVGDTKCRDALRSCDIIFGCTDDNAGRIFLNRLAHFYLIPLIDMGLKIGHTSSTPPRIQAIDGRVSIIFPGKTCLLCYGIINTQRAREEEIQRENPNEYKKLKKERYVVGNDDPNPAVVSFNTEISSMAVNELIHRLTGFRTSTTKSPGQWVKKFHLMEAKRPGNSPRDMCPICSEEMYWGLGDVTPFLDSVS